MAGEVSKEKVGSVLMQAMLAAKNLHPQRDRLLQLQRRLQRLQSATPAPGPDAAKLRELYPDLFKVYYYGMEAGARMLTSCLEIAVENGGRFPMNPSFARMPDERLYDTLLAQAQRLPARPTTQAEALARVEAALFAVKLPEEYHIPRCIEHLIGERPAHPGAKRETSTDGKPRQKTAIDVDKALDYLDRGCTILSLAVEHVDLAVAVLSRFLDPKRLASLAEFTDRRAYISEEGPYPSTD